MVPLLLKPKWLGFRNRWAREGAKDSQSGQELVIILFSAIVMLSIYAGVFSSLMKMRENENLAYLPASVPLGLLLLLLFSMLIFSSLVGALGTLFLSKDLELIISSPIPTRTFFFGKFGYVFGSSSWMALIFGLPVFIAFARVYEASFDYFFWITFLLIPYFAIPSAAALIIITIFTRIFPANRTKEIVLLIFLMTVVCGIFIAQAISRDSSSWKLNDVLYLMSMLSVPNKEWLPSYWVAQCLGMVLERKIDSSMWTYCTILWSSAICTISFSYLAVKHLHFNAYSKSQSTGSGLRIKSKRSQAFYSKILGFIPAPHRAVLGKEFKVFARDMTQAVQLLLLIGLCMIYLYNFRILSTVKGLPEDSRLWWQALLVLVNLGMGAFVISAVCTRFVFPSLSLEGKAFWILHSSPMPIRELLRAKFWCWFIPIASISSVIFLSGALAIQAEPHIIALSGMASWVMCYGIVGLGIGYGAHFANFNWEHSSQLSASFGSFMYMLSSIILILVSMVPIGILIFMRTIRTAGYSFSNFEWYSVVVCCSALLVYINFAATRLSLGSGETSLSNRQ